VRPSLADRRVEVETVNRCDEFSVVSVEIDGYDLDFRQDHVAIQFFTDDESAPILTNEWPENGSVEVVPYTDISFDVYDTFVAVDLSSANISVDHRNVIVGGITQDGWTTTILPTTVDGYDGYSFNISSDRRYALDSEIGVSVDIADAYGNTLDGYFSFTTYNDITEPEITNLDPASGEVEVALDKDIAFKIIDGYDVDINSLNVHIDNHPAILNGVFQPGYNGQSNAIYEIEDGYGIVIDPIDKYSYNQQVTVVIDGYDLSGNHIGYEYYFYTIADTNAPTISNRVPYDTESEVALALNISFDITDSVSGVNGSLLDVHVDSVPAILDGEFQEGFNGGSSSIVPIADGYAITIDPVDDRELFYNQIRTVTVDGYDYALNHVHDDYYFATISDPNEPVLSNFSPLPGSDEAPITTDIVFDITDAVSGVNLSALNVWINEIPAVFGGTITAPFADVNSGITAITDGYRISLDLIVDFWYNEVETVVIDGYDFAENNVYYEYSFLTKVDVNAPTVTPIEPLDSVGDYLRTTNISFRINDDESGVDLDTVDVVIDNQWAMENGEFVSGFDGAQSYIIQMLDGYEITIDPTFAFDPSHTIRVVIDGYDFANNQKHFEYIFTTVDDVGPYVFDFHPEPNSVDATTGPLHISFGIKDSGDGEVNLATLYVNVSSDAGGSYIPLYDPINWFADGWAGSITKQPDHDGYIFNAYNDGLIDSFSVYSLKITATDHYGNTSNIVIGQESEFVGGSTGTVSAYNRLDVGQEFIDSNQIDTGDLAIINGVSALVVDGYDGDDIIFDRQIAAGGALDFSIYRGSFMTKRNLFTTIGAEITADDTIRVDYNNSFSTPGNELSYTLSGGDFPVAVDEVTDIDGSSVYLTTEVAMQPSVNYLLTIDNSTVLDEFGFPLDDGYEEISIAGYADFTQPTILEAFVGPFNINVTVLFDDFMLQNEDLLNPSSYILSHGAYVTSVEATATDLDVVVLTVENLYGREEFGINVSTRLKDVAGNHINSNYNHAVIRLDQTGAGFAGITGKLKTRDAVNRLYEDSSYWYVATSGGLDVIDKYDHNNVGFILDGYGITAVTATDGYIYFGSDDGYVADAYQTGVFKLWFDKLDGNSTAHVTDAFALPTIQSPVINDLFRGTHANEDVLVVATDSGATTIIGEQVVQYCSGCDISSAHLDAGGTTLYIANNTRKSVDVFYNINLNSENNRDPDAYYSAMTSPEILDGYISQIKVVNNSSIMDADSNTLYIATDVGLSRVDTDESVPGASEGGGIGFSYGIDGSGAIFEELGGQTNNVVAVDVNTQTLQLFVLTNDAAGQGGLTIINIPSNKQFSYRSHELDTLISRDLRDLTFKNL